MYSLVHKHVLHLPTESLVHKHVLHLHTESDVAHVLPSPQSSIKSYGKSEFLLWTIIVFYSLISSLFSINLSQMKLTY